MCGASCTGYGKGGTALWNKVVKKLVEEKAKVWKEKLNLPKIMINGGQIVYSIKPLRRVKRIVYILIKESK